MGVMKLFTSPVEAVFLFISALNDSFYITAVFLYHVLEMLLLIRNRVGDQVLAPKLERPKILSTRH